MSRRAICAVLVAALAGGCGVSANQAAGLPPASVARPKPASFPAWREEFRAIALRSGISAGVFEAASTKIASAGHAQAHSSQPTHFSRPSS